MKRAKDLSKKELVEIVDSIQKALYLAPGVPEDCLSDEEIQNGIKSDEEYWHPDLEWDPGHIENVASVLYEHGLVPAKMTPLG